MVLSVTVVDDVVVVLPSISSNRLRHSIASSIPCAAALFHHSRAFVSDCSTTFSDRY